MLLNDHDCEIGQMVRRSKRCQARVSVGRAQICCAGEELKPKCAIREVVLAHETL